MKKLISTVLALVMVFAGMLGMFAFPAGAATVADSGWYDANATTLDIYDAADLAAFAEKIASGAAFYGVTVNLMADVDVNPDWDGTLADIADATYVWPTMKYDSSSAANTPENSSTFHGTFNGNGHTISGIYHDSSVPYAGIFGLIHYISGELSVVLKDFTIAKSYFCRSKACSSGLISIYHVTSPTDLTIENVHVSENVLFECSDQGAFYLGWYGYKKPTTIVIKNCIFSGTCKQTTSGKGMAAFIGSGNNYSAGTYSNNITVASCAMYGTVEGSGDCISGIGDDVRVQNTFTVTNCVVAGSVSANSSNNINYICRNAVGTYTATNNIIVHNSSTTDVAGTSATGSTVVDSVASLTGVSAQAKLDTSGITGFVASTTGLPVLKNTQTTNEVASAVTKYYGYQVNASNNKLRLIGLANILPEELANYDAVGFKVVGYYMEDGSKVNAFEAEKTTVYTAIKAGDETWTTTGVDAGSYIFVQEITGIDATKPLLLEITTFHVTEAAAVNGNTTTVVLNSAS